VLILQCDVRFQWGALGSSRQLLGVLLVQEPWEQILQEVVIRFSTGPQLCGSNGRLGQGRLNTSNSHLYISMVGHQGGVVLGLESGLYCQELLSGLA